MIIHILIYFKLIYLCLSVRPSICLSVSLSLYIYIYIEINVDDFVSHLKHAVLIILSAYLIHHNLS